MYNRPQKIHFVGIGGIGMSGIAELLINLGHEVSGSDLRESDTTRRLRSLGARITIGHRPEAVEGVDVVVMSSAVGEDNPEVAAARRLKIPVIPRAEMLAELMRLKYGIAVAGSHGKTTCTSMVATVLAGAGLDPTIVVGGKLAALGTNAVLGKGEFLVAEADESDGSFNLLSPVVVVVTNVDREHMDHYHTDEALEEAFVEFMNKVPFYGAAIVCLDDERLTGLIPRVRRRVITYGMSAQADFQARGVVAEGYGSRFSLVVRGENVGELRLPVPGQHNILNALAAVAVGVELGVEPMKAAKALENFRGVARRMEVKGQGPADTVIVDDYAHHPTEIIATLEAVGSCWSGRKVVVIFQPHRYTRTRDLMGRFAKAFYAAHHLVILPIYPAGEQPIPGVSAEVLADAVAAHGHRSVHYAPDMHSALKTIKGLISGGEIIITMGAGDVWKIGEKLLEEARGGHGQGA